MGIALVLKRLGGLKVKEDRLEDWIVRSLRSPLEFEARRAQRKIVCRAEEEPRQVIPALLRNYGHEDPRVREGVRKALSAISETGTGKASILDEMVNPSKMVRKGLQSFLSDEVGTHAATFASLYEQTMLTVAMAKQKEIPVDDITLLADQSRRVLQSGDVMRAVRDIAYCLDLVKHRYRSSEQCRDYLTDLLKMAPDLCRMGVYRSTIEEPLHKAMRALRDRQYDETKDIVGLRTKESQLIAALCRLERGVRENVSERPRPPTELQDEDRELLSHLEELIVSFASKTLEDHHEEAVTELLEFLMSSQAGPSRLSWRRRLDRKDPSALFTLYIVGLASAKLAAAVLPQAVEDIYQRELRSLVGEVSIHMVRWPDNFLGAFFPPREDVETTSPEGEEHNIAVDN
ncbi:hypothetical protein AOA80_03795 [Methanomassiliicoccales archaeon RumEn M1]|jgi:hypothetical protein|nr:hypothetical protein AOA80_03795 [Methanomassiliicoccales archaeon RumEn M1]